ncbi:MAG: hypothetical protein GY745_09570 [Actinomycetia bacterium]|nr:hypothetical protein [Actinomycetes bacterium]
MTGPPTAAAWRGFDGVLAGLLVVGVGTMFLPWASSGQTSRNSIELMRSADRLDLLDGWMASVGLGVWLAMPFVAAAAVVALTLGHRLLGTALGAVVAVTLVAGVWAVKAAPLRADGGMTVALIVGVLTMAFTLGGYFYATRDSTSDP